MAVFIDFDYARLGSWAMDAAYLLMPFASCWCVNQIPSGLTQELQRVYRSEAAKGFPEIADDGTFSKGIAEASAWWLIAMFHGGKYAETFAEDRPLWHEVATHRQRILTWVRSAKDALSVGGCHLPATQEFVSDIEAVLSQRWRGLASMPSYPALRYLPG